MSTVSNKKEMHSLAGERIAFIGKLAGMSKREAQKLVRRHAAVALEEPSSAASLIVMGEEETPLGNLHDAGRLLNDGIREAVERGVVKVLSETQLWQRLGFVETEKNIHRFYTPAMLADLLGVSVSLIRRWHRRGIIVPVRQVRRLPYFDYQEVATARRLVELLCAGCSPQAVENKLDDLEKFLPGIRRPLTQLSVIVEGKQLLVRRDEGLSEPGGQLRFDFVSVDNDPRPSTTKGVGQDEPTVSLDKCFGAGESTIAPEDMLARAFQSEDEGDLVATADMYRAILVASGPNAEINFLLAEVLYRMGDLAAARERYYVAVEMDEDYIEARANLGCVLSEMEQYELAVAAFEGTLAYHENYPDVHYHLAHALDTLSRLDEARHHWRAFLGLAPNSPWADEVRERLRDETPIGVK